MAFVNKIHLINNKLINEFYIIYDILTMSIGLGSSSKHAFKKVNI